MAIGDDLDLDADAVIRVSAYTYPGTRQFGHPPLIEVKPGVLDPVRDSIFQSLGPSPTLDFGRLGRLPLELVSLVCLLLDISSALSFSQANHAARNTMASIPQYRLLSAHALPHIWALFRTGMAPHTSISTLHSALTSQDCACGSFGYLLFLPTATRCCLDCLRKAPELQIVSLKTLADAIGFSPETLRNSLPAFQPLRGHGGEGPIVTRRVALRWMRENRVQRNEAFIDYWLNSAPPKKKRYRAAIPLPFVNTTSGEAQPGLLCKGCPVKYVVEEYYIDEEVWAFPDRFYSRDEFLQHFRECKEAQQLWDKSKGGTVEVGDPFDDSDL